MSESDEALLRRAAKTVRERAAGTSLAPWARPYYDDTEQPGFPFWMVHNGGVGMREHAVVSTFPLNPQQEQDARWIAFASPAFAEPLAAWLEKAAQSAEIVTGTGYSVQREAIAVARALLGEAARPRPTREETLTELARMEAEGDAFYAAHPEIDPDEPHAVRVLGEPALTTPVGDDREEEK